VYVNQSLYYRIDGGVCESIRLLRCVDLTKPQPPQDKRKALHSKPQTLTPERPLHTQVHSNARTRTAAAKTVVVITWGRVQDAG